jgi:hypothetical protein
MLIEVGYLVVTTGVTRSIIPLQLILEPVLRIFDLAPQAGRQ